MVARYAPHTIDRDRIRAYFGRHRKVESAGVVEAIAREGVPAEVGAGGSLENGLAYGNHTSAFVHRGEVLKKAATDVAMGRAVVFLVTETHEVKGLQISPAEVLEEKRKLRVIHALTFGGQANAKEGGGGGGQGSVLKPKDRSVNARHRLAEGARVTARRYGRRTGHRNGSYFR